MNSLDRNLLGELGHAAEMIAVAVRDDQMIDLREAGILDRLHDAAGVAHRARRRCRCR